MALAPVYDFSSDGVQQTVWVIDNEKDIEIVAAAFDKTPCLYIADGHHRSASAVRVGKKRREQYPDYDGTEECEQLTFDFVDEDLPFPATD
mgnify:CR=1 FL=1